MKPLALKHPCKPKDRSNFLLQVKYCRVGSTAIARGFKPWKIGTI